MSKYRSLDLKPSLFTELWDLALRYARYLTVKTSCSDLGDNRDLERRDQLLKREKGLRQDDKLSVFVHLIFHVIFPENKKFKG